MSTDPQPPGGPREHSACGDRNIERLLGQAYRPEVPDSAFVRRVEERLLQTARELALSRSREALPEAVRLQRLRYRLNWVLGVAAALAAFALVGHTLRPLPLPWPAQPEKQAASPGAAAGPTARPLKTPLCAAGARPPAPAPKRSSLDRHKPGPACTAG